VDQIRKNIILLISLGVLSLISLGLYWGGMEGGNEIDPAIFQLTDSKSVDGIIIQKPGEKIEIKFANGKWHVNEMYEADADLITVLFATMDQAIPKREVATKLRDSITSQMLKAGIKVAFLSGVNKQKEFLVMGSQADGLTYFMDTAEPRPYVMVIPGYRVYVAGIFEQDGNTWRDKRIFNFNWRNFKELSAEFPRDPKQNFNVAMTGRFFSIVDVTDSDTTALNNYLDAVSLINADAFYKRGESSKTDSLSKSDPVMIIQVKDVGDQLYSLKVFEVGKTDRNALAQWGDDLVWFDRRNILQLYKKKKDFLK
jgi:hypothetical protein